jgi:hypothetical protein
MASFLKHSNEKDWLPHNITQGLFDRLEQLLGSKKDYTMEIVVRKEF